MTARFSPAVLAALVAVTAAASPSMGEDVAPMPSSQTQPFQPYVDMKTFMEHVLTPAAKIIWSVNAVVIDEQGEHDLSPKPRRTGNRSSAARRRLAEATNALMIPQRARDPQWVFYVQKLAEAANKAYLAAEARDLKSISEVSDRLDGICAACHRHYGLE